MINFFDKENKLTVYVVMDALSLRQKSNLPI